MRCVRSVARIVGARSGTEHDCGTCSRSTEEAAEPATSVARDDLHRFAAPGLTALVRGVKRMIRSVTRIARETHRVKIRQGACNEALCYSGEPGTLHGACWRDFAFTT